MNKSLCIALLGLLALAGCKSNEKMAQQNAPLPAFDTEGHRGARGLMPENTIPAMIKAIDLGVTTIEMDCHITKDGKVVVTHDPHLNPAYARTPQGQNITEEESHKYAVYQMDYEQVRAFEMGTKPYDLYPQQQKTKTYIPLLAELVDSVQAYLKENKLPQVFYNIEVKSKEGKDGELHPAPAEFVSRMVEVLQQKEITPYVIIQSFDKRALQELRRQYPQVRASLLVSNKLSVEENLAELGFTPDVYSPNAKLVDAALIKACHDRNIKVIPWTVNSTEDMQRLKVLGVDGIISDYPNLFSQVL
ncbi:glycerophosphodiester phosphodiesterase family protein [Pontibacter oryzae]|uniref:Glycerophosphodiester phosphodiesterase n=1 Tax=Pontibacter oryzae TaxID=2304593 RepID=A0A399SJU1_9BACT|nr:glycerophosphodiester phosphodiesterase family protein [Pontibacter oryzae]RIJ43061.1 glycerophosphodiester phosphodiesterase [Pontibacter oryzae]